jgi:tetratricopeptide (TPR) repeat protein
MQKKPIRIFLWTILGLAVLIGLYFLPPIHSRLAWRVDNLRTQIKYYFNPPDEAVFQPSAAEATVPPLQATAEVLQTLAPTATPEGVEATATSTLPPTIVPTAIPERMLLAGFKYIDQHNRWNYCGPANLTMALSYWGWQGTRDDVAKVIKPGEVGIKDFIQAGKADKNVMPYEMLDFVNEQTEYTGVLRYGGTPELIKRFIAAGYPVVVEKGYYERDYTGKVAWLGHYQYVTGYDDGTQEFIVQDTYNDGPDHHDPYAKFEEGWRSFNYLFMVVYPPAQENAVNEILGLWLDETWANQYALEIAETETNASGNDEFFAWFNKGTSLVQLQRYPEAASAFDQAFTLYADLGQDDTQRPYRIMWYQTSPYFAYFYTGRYQDVINLANTTLNETISEPTLEESLYWRAMAEYALGDTTNAYADMLETVRLNPNFGPGLFRLELWGIQ